MSPLQSLYKLCKFQNDDDVHADDDFHDPLVSSDDEIWTGTWIIFNPLYFLPHPAVVVVC